VRLRNRESGQTMGGRRSWAGCRSASGGPWAFVEGTRGTATTIGERLVGITAQSDSAHAVPHEPMCEQQPSQAFPFDR